MSRPRRRGNAQKTRNAGSAGNSRQSGAAGNARRKGNARGARKAGNSRNGGGRNNRGARSGRAPAGSFWRDTGSQDQPRAAAKIQPTTDPSALPRSLGEPPLAPDTAPLHHLAVVYEEAVRTATALAAANGLLLDDSDGSDSAAAPVDGGGDPAEGP
jgi:hypothetical protein